MKGFAARDGAGYGVGDDTVVFGFDEEFGGCSDEVERRAGDVEEVG